MSYVRLIAVVVALIAFFATAKAGNADSFVDEILTNVNQVYKSEIVGKKFDEVRSSNGKFLVGCKNPHVQRLDSISRHGDASIIEQGDGMYDLSLTVQINEVHARCDGYGKALFIKINQRVELGFAGLRVQMSARLNLRGQNVQILNAQINEKWGYREDVGKIAKVVIKLFRVDVEKRILKTINSVLAKEVQKRLINFDFSKLAG